MPSAPAALSLPPAPPQRFRTPEFVHRYDFRPVQGSLGTPSETMNSLMWVREAEPRLLDARSVAAIWDAPFPAIWLRMPAPVMITTVVYNVFFRVVTGLLRPGKATCCSNRAARRVHAGSSTRTPASGAQAASCWRNHSSWRGSATNRWPQASGYQPACASLAVRHARGRPA